MKTIAAIFSALILLAGCAKGQGTTIATSIRREPTKTVIANPTLTYVPALSPTAADSNLIELIANNGDCRLPCFLGITPGQTTITELRSATHPYWNITSDVLFGEMGGGLDLDLIRDEVILKTSIIASRDDRRLESDTIRLLKVFFGARKEVHLIHEPVYGDPYYAEYFQYYSLNSLLENYGMPEHVSVGVELAADMGGLDEYFLFLDYTHLGWVARITMPAVAEGGSRFSGCPKWGFTNLYLWEPGDTDTAKLHGMYQEEKYPWPLEEATSLTLNEFYQQFRSPTNLCLVTDLEHLKFPQ